jgi:ABC-type enterochelin transport system permease subunit
MISSILLIFEAAHEVFLFIIYYLIFLGSPSCIVGTKLHCNGWKIGWKNCTLTSFMEYVVLGILISFNAEPVGSVVVKKPSHRSLIWTPYMGYNLLTWLIRGYIIMLFSQGQGRVRVYMCECLCMYVCMYVFICVVYPWYQKKPTFWALLHSPIQKYT